MAHEFLVSSVFGLAFTFCLSTSKFCYTTALLQVRLFVYTQSQESTSQFALAVRSGLVAVAPEGQQPALSRFLAKIACVFWEVQDQRYV